MDCYAVAVHRGDGEAVLAHRFEMPLDRLLSIRARFLDRLALSYDARQLGTNTL